MTRIGKVIGKDNQLPWDIPEELAQFRRLTLNSTVIMGRRTYDSIGRPMPKRHNIVVSRHPRDDTRVEWATSVEEAVERAKEYDEDIFIIGGAEIYRQGIPFADMMYLSFINDEYEGDTYFPEWDESEWFVEKREDHEDFEFVVYRRK